ncbi:cytochrome C oxidase subunit IV family protein [Nocardia sp. NPDC059246]|uniref:cytochrome C oxidase subunit IV family protein n=1 Tax=unclassified Nocardia TaxID=2637762 RepID=UPI0036A33670
MTVLLRTPATMVWILLAGATSGSWALGTHEGSGDHHALASVAVLLIAFTKIRFVGLYFMELREAPIVLRGLFEAYCVIVFLVVAGTFLFA